MECWLFGQLAHRIQVGRRRVGSLYPVLPWDGWESTLLSMLCLHVWDRYTVVKLQSASLDAKGIRKFADFLGARRSSNVPTDFVTEGQATFLQILLCYRRSSNVVMLVLVKGNTKRTIRV